MTQRPSATASPEKAPSDPATIDIAHKHWPPNRSGGGLLTLRRVVDQPDSHLHDHAFDELAYVRAGTATHVTAAGERPLETGDVVILRPLVWHGYQACRGFWIDNLIFDAVFLTQLFPLVDRQSGWFDGLRGRTTPDAGGPPVIRLSAAEQTRIFEALDEIEREQQATAPGWETAAAAATLTAITHTARAMARVQPHTGSQSLSPRTEEAVAAAAQRLQAQPTHAISVPELARHVALSPHHLSRAFARRMGEGIVDYAHRLRVERACHLLRTTDLPVTEIALQVGYDEIAYFSRRFRKVLGCSPSTYRQQIKTV